MAKIKKPKYEPPTQTFPYKIKWRLMMLSKPRKQFIQTNESMPAISPTGVRVSALRGAANDRITDLNYPYLSKKNTPLKINKSHSRVSFNKHLKSQSRESVKSVKNKRKCISRIINVEEEREVWQLLKTKRRFKGLFPVFRIDTLDHYIELSNATCYSKLANCVIDLKKSDVKETSKKKRGWSDSDWKKHMDYINGIAGPRPMFEPEPVERGPSKPIGEFKYEGLLFVPEHKVYRRLSKEDWYRDPTKVSAGAMKYVITDRTLKLAAPKVYPNPDS